MTVTELVTHWYRTYKSPFNQKSTNRIAESNIKVHLAPSDFGAMDISEVTTKDVQEFLTELMLHGNKCKLINYDKVGQPLSNRSVRKFRQMLIAGFRQGIKDGLITQNPAEGTEPPPIARTMVTTFSPAGQKAFLAHTKKRRFHAAYAMLFFTGCRRGEIMGLSWDDINWQENCFYIRQTLVEYEGEIILKAGGKTQSSVRTIPLPRGLKRILKDVWERTQEERKAEGYSNPHNLIFTNKDGSFYSPQALSRNFKSIAVRMGFSEDIHLHCTRHTWATNMLQLGNAIPDIQALGGWTSSDMLLNIYAHTLKISQKKAMDKLWRSLN